MEQEFDEQIDFLHDDMVCSVCYAEFLDNEDLQLHVKQLHLNEASKNRFCKICTQIYPDIESYALHLRNDHLSSLKCCKYCMRLFQDTDELLQHEKKHNAVVLYPKISCSHCENIFNKKNELQTHEYKEHCDLEDGLNLWDCMPVLSSLLNMNAKQFFEASYSNVLYICAVCETTTSDVSVYIQHLITENCRSLSCNECCNVYTSKSKLAAHMSRHINVNNVQIMIAPKKQCTKCKNFFKSTSLQSHLKKCTEMSCTPCKKTFNSISEYSKHVTEHSKKLLPLEICIYCQRQMVGAEAMAKHVERAHKHETHLYKYHCTDCDRLFKHPKFLFAHFYSKHKDLHPYTCKICDKKFRVRKNFSLHIKLDHKSVGFVEFDDNFHVTFTDKKSEKQSKCQNVAVKAMKKNDENIRRNVDNKESDSLNCENTDNSCKIELETISDSNILNQSVKDLGEIIIELKPETADDYNLRENEHFVVKFDVANAIKNIGNKTDNDETGSETDEKCTSKHIHAHHSVVVNNALENLNNKTNDETPCETDEKPMQKCKPTHHIVLDVIENLNSETDYDETRGKHKHTHHKVNINNSTESADNKIDSNETDYETDVKHMQKRKRTCPKVYIDTPIENLNNESDYDETNCDVKEKSVRKRKRNSKLQSTQCNKKSRNYTINISDEDNSSNDSDVPLEIICKKIKLKSKHRNVCRTPWNKTFRNPKFQNNKFFCIKCKRNCYTYQNYERHKALHVRNETKICIKCYGKFDSVRALNEHIKAEHSSSKLTETLKKLLEKRKNTETNHVHSNDKVLNKKLSTSEKFQNTVKKVHIEKCHTKATITRLDSNKISVKKFLENFVPESNEVKLTMLNHRLTLDTSGIRRRQPLIKLTKFTPDPINEPQPISLKMPVKFTDDTTEHCKVSVRIVHGVRASSFNKFEDQNVFNDNAGFDDSYDNYDTAIPSKIEAIPEVAQEVMLVGTVEPCKVLHTMSLKNLATQGGDIAIAHLSPHAPFYKISKFKGLVDKEGQSFILNQPQVEDVPKDITLPNGKKLVNVNPLAHLLAKSDIKEVLKARRPYYKPKLRNVKEAITKAMEKLDNTPVLKKKVL